MAEGSWQNSWEARNQISFNIKARTDWSRKVLIATNTKSNPNLSALTQHTQQKEKITFNQIGEFSFLHSNVRPTLGINVAAHIVHHISISGANLTKIIVILGFYSCPLQYCGPLNGCSLNSQRISWKISPYLIHSSWSASPRIRDNEKSHIKYMDWNIGFRGSLYHNSNNFKSILKIDKK